MMPMLRQLASRANALLHVYMDWDWHCTRACSLEARLLPLLCRRMPWTPLMPPMCTIW